jgi:hypothetical protein
MQRFRRSIPPFAVLAVLVLAGCSSLTDPAREEVLKPDTAYKLDYDASRRGGFLLPSSQRGKFILVSEPAPDVAVQSVADLSAKLSYQGIDGTASAKLTQTMIELGKRTQAVMMLRELMFRVSELYASGALTQAQVEPLVQEIIKAATMIANADQLDSALKAFGEIGTARIAGIMPIPQEGTREVQ